MHALFEVWAIRRSYYLFCTDRRTDVIEWTQPITKQEADKFRAMGVRYNRDDGADKPIAP